MKQRGVTKFESHTLAITPASLRLSSMILFSALYQWQRFREESKWILWNLSLGIWSSEVRQHCKVTLLAISTSSAAMMFTRICTSFVLDHENSDISVPSQNMASFRLNGVVPLSALHHIIMTQDFPMKANQ